MDRYSVIVSQRADEMLVKHARFLAQVSVPAATRIADEFGRPGKEPVSFPSEDAYEFRRGFAKHCSANGIKQSFQSAKKHRKYIWMRFWIAGRITRNIVQTK